MRLKYGYFNFVTNVGFFILGCTLSCLFFILNFDLPTNNAFGSVGSLKINQIDLIIIVLSAPKNKLGRNVLRNTWVKQIKRNSVHIFTVGIEGLSLSESDRLVKEQRTYGDLIFLPMVDSYRNLTLKVAASFKAVTPIYNFKHVLKVDEDSFVNINRLTSELSELSDPLLYWGYFSPSAHVFSSGKWKEQSWYLCDRYLPYALGGGYVLGFKLAKYIADNQHLFRLYSSEDVSVGVWLSATLTLRIHDIRFDTQAKSRGCYNDQIVKHKVTPGDMLEYSNRIERGLNLCKEQTGSELKAYSYDWTKKPSKCCKVIDPLDSSEPKLYSSVGQI